jgi:hypothetical protein
MSQASTLPILVRQSVFNAEDDKEIVSALIDEYVNPLMQRGYYLMHELPANAMRSYHTDYYLAQVANGGHRQFIHNSGVPPLMLKDICEGLAAIALEPYVGIFKDFEAFVTSDPERAARVAEHSNCELDPILKDLDDRFFASDCYRTLMPANGRWLKGLPELKVVPDTEFEAAIENLIAANPGGKARKMAFERPRFSSQLQDTKLVAARLLGCERHIFSLDVGYGDPSAKALNGRSTIGWAIRTLEGPFTMFLLDDSALLCRQYTADGRLLAGGSLIDKRHSSVLSGEPDIYLLEGSVWKEFARVPIALVEEAKSVAKDGNVLAAAEIACGKLGDDLVNLFAAAKTDDGYWCFYIFADNGIYFLYPVQNGMMVTGARLNGVKIEPLTIRLDDIHRYKAAWDDGRA